MVRIRPSLRPVALLPLLALLAWPALGAGDDRERHLVPDGIPVLSLDAASSFAALSDREKLYAHWMNRAAWDGVRISFRQASEEAPGLLELLLGVWKTNRVDLRRAASRAGVSNEDWARFQGYTAMVLTNAGNYEGFGKAKFVPRIDEKTFEAIVRAAAGLSKPADRRLLDLFAKLRKKIWSLEPDERFLGLESAGTSGYIGENVAKGEVELVGRFLAKEKLEGWNSRLFKDGKGRLEVRLASVEKTPAKSFSFEGRTVLVTTGDHSAELAQVVRDLEKAKTYAANDTERKMIDAYVRHFRTGVLEDHKEAQRLWVKDVAPAVESNLGFIETYGDPAGIRAEWEGWVAVVNKEQTRKFQALVDRAPELIGKLPWGKGFEKDRFQRPDFSSLDVVGFANGGIPAGINIPNYDDIRQTLGFKNVSLGNVLSAGNRSTERKSFIADEEQELFRKYSSPAFEVQVGLHELIGHGSGKLLAEKADGSFNFDRALLNPLTGAPVETWYKPGETWGGKFGDLAGPFEECRAETVALFLGLDPEVQKVFGHEGKEAEEVWYTDWLLMARMGVDALRYWDPATKSWGQAHMQARYAIFNTLLRAGDGLLSVEPDAKGEWTIRLDRTKVPTTGRRAVGDFLNRLGIWKATADLASAKAYWAELTTPDEKAMKLRDEAIRLRKPRGVWVQAVTDVDAAGKAFLREYPATYEGVIDSWVDRFGGR